MTNKRKITKEVLIAILLAVCLLFGVAVVILAEKFVGKPIFYNGEMSNIRIQISEVCSSNSSLIASDTGEFFDYIELYNYGETINLSGFGLSNDSNNSIAYKFGDIEFKGNSYMIVFLDGKKVPFRLNAGGNEYLALVTWDGTVVDSLTTVKTGSNEVMLLEGNTYSVTDNASPGYPNTEDGAKLFRNGIKDSNMSLVINEILTENGSVIADFQGEFTDIIELKNVSKSPINLSNYFISDTVSERNKCLLPDKTLAPGEIVTVFASGKDMLTEKGEFHTNFRLSVGERVVLSIGEKNDWQEVPICASNCSLSRIEGENGIEYQTMYATPGFENNEGGKEDLELLRIDTSAPLVINELLLSSDKTAYGGKLRDVIEIMNVSSGEVSTKDWFISDSESEPFRFALPEKVLKPNECMVLYAEKGVGDNICGFALSSGDSLYLTTPERRFSEPVSCAPVGEGKSKIRKVDNNEAIYVKGSISIGFPNDTDGIKAYWKDSRPSTVEISEAVALNAKYIAGPYKTFHDFIELHNRTDKEIDLTGYFLSDDVEEPRKGSLDGVKIPANGYTVIILSSDGVNTPSGYTVLDFSLASKGETVCLSKGDEIIDCMTIPSVSSNTSYGRANGSDGFAVLAEATPNAKNSKSSSSVTKTPTASLPQGVYDEDEITIELKGEGNIYYTLDCSVPNAESTLYTEPIRLTKTSVIRCFAVADGKITSDISNLTYVINENDKLETVTIVTTPENLFDHYSGIYATGPRADADFPYEGANYYQRWEKEATVSFFDKDGGGFSENCGIRIFGGLSRALPKKSFAVFFRKAYGNSDLEYQLFEDDPLDVYESFVLRNTGQDFRMSSMRDAMITKIANEHLGIDIQNNRPVVVYLNGEYWGIYFIREKLNENYVAGHYNVAPEEAQVVVANGHKNEDYKALVNYAWDHDLSKQEHYDHVCSLMDVENYADYIVAEMIIGNTDNGNIRYFTYEGGKWRWIMYDVDHAFRSASTDTVTDHLDPNGTGSGNNFSTRLVNSLLKNPDFKKMFLEKLAYQLENIWTPELVVPYIEEYKGMIQPDMKKECDRWEKSYDKWETSVSSLESFIKARRKYVISHVKNKFSLSDEKMREYGFKV